jgi:hypothetical protein
VLVPRTAHHFKPITPTVTKNKKNLQRISTV